MTEDDITAFMTSPPGVIAVTASEDALVADLDRLPDDLLSLSTAATGLGMTTASAHLQTLKQAGLVATSREGTMIRYRLAGSDVAARYVQIGQVAAAHLSDVDAARRSYIRDDDTEQAGRDELLRRAAAGEVTILDVRPAPEYAAGHVPGAISIPIETLAERLAGLPIDTEIVAYCRDPYRACLAAQQAPARRSPRVLAHRVTDLRWVVRAQPCPLTDGAVLAIH